DGWRVVRLRLRGAFDPKRRTGEECCLHIRVHFARLCGRTPGGRAAAAHRADTARGGAVHGPAYDEGHRPGGPEIALSVRCVASLWRRTTTVHRSRALDL